MSTIVSIRVANRDSECCFLLQVCCALIAYIPVLFGGMQAGFPAYIAPQLRKEISLTIDQMSWIGIVSFTVFSQNFM